MRSEPGTDVLVLDVDGKNLGKMPYRDAKSLAISKHLDLVQINKSHDVPVFKIMDHGKWKYEKKKQQHRQKSNTHHTKEMTFKVRIDPHDMGIKIEHIKDFLSRGMDVKISVVMRGREKELPELAQQKMDQILAAIGNFVQSNRQSTPSSISVMVRPNLISQSR